MITSLLIGRGKNKGLPGKNLLSILGRPLMSYPILAAKHSRYIERIFLSTECEEIKECGRLLGVEVIDRDPCLSEDSALVEDVVVDGFRHMERRVGQIDIFVLLFCNSATITPGIIDRGIEKLLKEPLLDSAVTVSKYNEYSPVRAMKISSDRVRNYLDVTMIPGASCDRDSAQDCFFIDCSAWILRSRCVDLQKGFMPFRWIGKEVFPLFQVGGLDIDHAYGIGQTEHWLRSHAFDEHHTPYTQ